MSTIRQEYFEIVNYARLMRSLLRNRAWEMLMLHQAKKELHQAKKELHQEQTELETDRDNAYFLPKILDDEDGQDVFMMPSPAQQRIAQTTGRLNHINNEIMRLKQVRIDAMYRYI